MTKLYIVGSYIVIGMLAFLGLRHINNLTTEIELQKLEISSMLETQEQLINSYNEEIEELTKSSKERKVVVKEIVKTIKGSDDEKCINSNIPSDIINRLREYQNKK